MNLEQLISDQNDLTFWREFTFTQLKFKVPGGELELADNLVRFGDVAIIVQMKEREVATTDPLEERAWFENKVMKSAVKQIKDSMKFLKVHGAIPVSNVHQVETDVRGDELREIHRLIIYQPGEALPEVCRNVRFKESKTAGFIHILSRDDYTSALNVLIAPEEIRRYLEYRQVSLRELSHAAVQVTEGDILAGYATEETLPTPQSHMDLGRLVVDASHYDLSSLLRRLADHIESAEPPSNHARILLEFAKLPRSAWRAAKDRLDLAITHAKTDESIQPYRFYFPATDCSFMFAPLPREAQTGENAAELRVGYLQTLTETAKYLAKAEHGIGVQVAYQDGHFLIDWCLATHPWAFDPEWEQRLEGNPFRPVREQKIDGFHFCT